MPTRGSKKNERWKILINLDVEGDAFTNAEIGEIFGVCYTAVRHIVNKVKGQLEANRGYGKDYKLINSQIKM